MCAPLQEQNRTVAPRPSSLSSPSPRCSRPKPRHAFNKVSPHCCCSQYSTFPARPATHSQRSECFKNDSHTAAHAHAHSPMHGTQTPAVAITHCKQPRPPISPTHRHIPRRNQPVSRANLKGTQSHYIHTLQPMLVMCIADVQTYIHPSARINQPATLPKSHHTHTDMHTPTP